MCALFLKIQNSISNYKLIMIEK
ncbi:peptidase families S8 and S53 subfamily [Trichinella spiralis]|nr:peptidase families S8 and S53 subfamily [Trichinella spiralis]